MNKYDSVLYVVKDSLKTRTLTNDQIEAYENVLKFIQEEISKQEEYQVDYNCPERAEFISLTEKHI